MTFQKCVTRNTPPCFPGKFQSGEFSVRPLDYHRFLMASCTYANLVGGVCGPSISNPANVECVAIGNCEKDVYSQLVNCKISDDCVDRESNLLLSQAGKILTVAITKHQFYLYVL